MSIFKKPPPPVSYATKEEVQEMIDDAIRKHNRNAGIISMCVGWVVLALFAEGLLRLIGVIDPIFPWLENHIIDWIGVVLLFVFGVTMICQGHFIYHQKHGYSRKETENPEARDRVRRQIEAIRGNRKDDSSS